MGSSFSSLGSGFPSFGGAGTGTGGSSPFGMGTGLSMPGGSSGGFGSFFPGFGGGSSGGSGGSGLGGLFPGLGGGGSGGGFGSFFPGMGGGGTSQDSMACTDYHLVFARGTTEPQGLGILGQPLAAGLKSKLNSFSSYAVVCMMQNSASGSRDAEAHTYLAKCPQAKIILGGYSQGASLVHGIKGADFAQAVCSIVLYGDPYLQFGPMVSFGQIGLPISDQSKVFNACNKADIICGKSNQLGTGFSHLGYYPGVSQASINFVADACKSSAGSNATIRSKRSEREWTDLSQDQNKISSGKRMSRSNGHLKMRASANMTQNQTMNVLDTLFTLAAIPNQHSAMRPQSVEKM